MTGTENPFERPAVRYGIAGANAALIVVVALLLVDRTFLRLLVLGFAVLEFVVTPMILKRAVENG
jgi:hypothetical protein